MKIEKVLIVGSGTMGQQIGLQCAMNGFHTTMYDISDKALERCKAGQEAFISSWRNANPDDSDEDVAAGLARLSYNSDLESAAEGVDLVNESVPENLEIKQAVYSGLSRYCRPDTILTTNTSTLLPSNIAPFVERPERFLALHFGNLVWEAPIGEVMGHPGTDAELFEQVLEFAQQIRMVPIPIEKEQPGYLINTLLQPWLIAAMSLVSNGVATHQQVDKTWMICSGMPAGPFGILDTIGAETAYNVTQLWTAAEPDDPQHARNAAYVKENLLDKGRLGTQTGGGYYDYPNPEFAQPGFLE